MLDNVKFSRLKRKVLGRPWVVRIGIVMIFLLSIFLVITFFAYIFRVIGLSTYIHLASKFITAPVEEVAAESGKSNILIMGKSGGTHSGPELTDTMLVASVSLTKPEVVIISIPRDIWIPEARAKINSAYYYGRMPLSKSLTSKVLGIPIHYGVLIDFSGFTKVIDILGGVSVNVERSFTDSLYPIGGQEDNPCIPCRYETVTFHAGEQTMDGATTLKFVRSRHAIGDEGTDIAREARQQKIIAAIKNKILDPTLLFKPRKAFEIFRVLKSSTETDISSETAAILARKIFNSRDNIISNLIPEDLLINPPTSKIYDNQYVFTPAAGNGRWDDVHHWVETILQ